METRYYLSRIIGDGKTIATAFRPAIADIVDAKGNSAFSTMITAETDKGIPVRDWALVIAEGEDHTLADGHPDIDPLPVVALDAKVAQIDPAVKQDMDAKLAKWGIAVGVKDSYADVITTVGKLQDPEFKP